MVSTRPILVTGASGFVALHTIIQLLEQGYKVRATLRTLSREAEVRETVAKHVDINDKLEIVTADLSQDSGWNEIVKGCESVLHIASPFPLFEPKNEDELILPAVQGTQRVLRAAHDANIKRVVIVSSVAAVSAGHHGENKTFDENDWSIIENNIGAYSKSKTLAERAAWAFINGAENKNKMEMVAINPPLIAGPVPNKDFPTSAELISTFMLGQVPGVARIKMGFVDVRDVASALILAMTTPEAAGNRFIVSAGTMWLKEIAETLYKNYASRGYKKIPRIEFPSFLVRILALFDKKIARVSGDLNWDYGLLNEKAKRILKWNPRTPEESILSMAESLIEQGFV
ncbi:MAG: NAD-dependent epimerase/dehydratase family protein [Chloroflexi bacterium]|nr:NAD-dependent epimerase/dehydratase family protein [Chloroflexota bacterium]